jgi:hypothetical protein
MGGGRPARRGGVLVNGTGKMACQQESMLWLVHSLRQRGYSLCWRSRMGNGRCPVRSGRWRREGDDETASVGAGAGGEFPCARHRDRYCRRIEHLAADRSDLALFHGA